MSIRFGVCGDVSTIPELIAAGYDYLEYNLTTLVRLSEADFAAQRKFIADCGMPVEAFNCFFPAEIPVTGPAADFSAISAHAEKGLRRAAELGGKIAVIGSGRARNIPEGFDFAEGYAQFVRTLQICGEIAKDCGMTIVVEPLESRETNLVNTVAQGLEVCRAANHSHVKCLADFYHIFMTGETLDAVRTAGSMLAHVHLARANPDRAMPCKEDVPVCREWAAALKECGYDARISLEGSHIPTFSESIRATREILSLFAD